MTQGRVDSGADLTSGRVDPLPKVNGNIFITLVVYVKHMKKSKWLDCQENEFFPKQKGTPSLVKIEHKNTATLDSARSEKKSKVAVLQLLSPFNAYNRFCCLFVVYIFKVAVIVDKKKVCYQFCGKV